MKSLSQSHVDMGVDEGFQSVLGGFWGGLGVVGSGESGVGVWGIDGVGVVVVVIFCGGV